MVLFAIVEEAIPETFNSRFRDYDVEIIRYDTEEMLAEIKSAEALQKKMHKEAEKELNKQKKTKKKKDKAAE